MEKKTLLAVALSVAVLGISYFVQVLRSQAVQTPPPAVSQPVVPVPEPAPEGRGSLDQPSSGQLMPVEEPVYNTPPDTAITQIDAGADNGPELEQRITIETELLTVILSNSGGDVVSYKLKKHQDKDDFVEMVLSGNNEAHAFTIARGGLNMEAPITSLFYVNRISEYTVEFYRDIRDQNGDFRLTKRYDFKPDDYMFELTVSLDGGYSRPSFNFNGYAYTLSFGPQMGPHFQKLDGRYDYRKYIIDGKRKGEKVNASNPVIISSRPKWAAVSGKYFACIAVPLLAQYDINFSEQFEPGIPQASRLNIIRPALNSSRGDDIYRFYLGPKNQETLNAYNTGNNGFGLSDMHFDEVASGNILAPLERLLKWLLLIFYRLVPNYGVAIILLTLLVKILFFPLTKKSSEATLRMQSVAPKIKELQEKYKDNRQKLNVEMAELYKKEGYNPLSGCLPMLLQIPIFFAMYQLFNNHFDLRGAMFISGWIPDLSQPEAIWNFPAGVRLPILGWTALRLLPFIYVGSQLLYGKVTQTPDQQANNQMKMMLYVMPVVFFFILYDVPSGLLIYWIFSNLLTMVQQVAINKYLAPKRAAQQAAAAASSAAAKILPPKKKKH